MLQGGGTHFPEAANKVTKNNSGSIVLGKVRNVGHHQGISLCTENGASWGKRWTNICGIVFNTISDFSVICIGMFMIEVLVGNDFVETSLNFRWSVASFNLFKKREVNFRRRMIPGSGLCCYCNAKHSCPISFLGLLTKGTLSRPPRLNHHASRCEVCIRTEVGRTQP